MDINEDRYYRDNPSLKHNLSFAGCGFLGLYHVGVCYCIKKYAHHLYHNKPISGTSAGAIAAACLVCDVNLVEAVQYMCKLVENVRQYTLGPFDPRFKITEHLREGLLRILPSDAHVICSGRLSISLTCYATQKNIVVRHYKDRDELITAILCSSYIPIFSGFVPLLFRGQAVIDGGLSNNLLCLDQRTIKVSPFAGDADICPLELTWGPQYHLGQPQKYDDILGSISFLNNNIRFSLSNIKRFISMVWPMSPTELANLASQGYDDALRFLTTRGFIACRLHRTPRAFSNVAQTLQRNSSDMRRRYSNSSVGISALADSEKTNRSRRISVDVTLNSWFQITPNVSQPSTPTVAFRGTGVGLNVAHCSACQEELHNALNSCLPTFLRSIIKGDNKPGRYSWFPSCGLPFMFFKNFVPVNANVWSFTKSVICFPLLLEVDILIFLIRRTFSIREGASTNLPYVNKFLSFLNECRSYLIRSKNYQYSKLNNLETSNGGTHDVCSVASSVHQKRKITNRKNSFVSFISSVVESSTENITDLILRLNQIHLPTAQECGLDLLNQPQPFYSENFQKKSDDENPEYQGSLSSYTSMSVKSELSGSESNDNDCLELLKTSNQSAIIASESPVVEKLQFTLQ